MKTRFFSFGCSFTNYRWPTWADIVGREFDYFENWGTSGAGNHFIFYSLIECIARNKISKFDTIGIMWSACHREDRFLKGKWHTPGSVYASPYPKDYVDDWCDPNHFLLTTCCLINATRQLLDSIGCRYWFFSMVPITMIDDSAILRIAKGMPWFESDVKDLFADSLAQVQPSVYEVVFKSDWRSLDHVRIPISIEESQETFRRSYENKSKKDWPHWADFLSNQLEHVQPEVLQEINNDKELLAHRHRVLTHRTDTHPTPEEHALYLQNMGFTITPAQQTFIDYWQDKVMSQKKILWMPMPVQRF